MNVFDTIFPNHSCLVCSNEINQSKYAYICDTCACNLPLHDKVCDKCGCEVSMHAFICERCKKSDWHFIRARSAFCYQSPIIELILRLKYNAESDVAKLVAPFLAEIYNDAAATQTNNRADLIIPVPLAPKREKQRGYNQSKLIAMELSKILNIKVNDSALTRIKQTEAQKDMTFKERQENLKNAFAVKNRKAIKDKHILLVDDVFTTGTTVNECARVLKKAKAANIEVLTIASAGKQG